MFGFFSTTNLEEKFGTELSEINLAINLPPTSGVIQRRKKLQGIRAPLGTLLSGISIFIIYICIL
jgi:hypothetical protein